MRTEKIEQIASKELIATIDNLVLQEIVSQSLKIGLKEDELVTVDLGVCPFTDKQRIMLNHDRAEERCMYCENPVTTKVVVYQMEKTKQVLCLETEVEDMIQTDTNTTS